jgi:putative transposase
VTNYPSNLTESQYRAILGIIGDKRKRKRSLKEILDAIFYLLKTGCQWRQLPGDFPNWKLVYYYFHKWSWDGTLEEIHDILHKHLRRKRGRNPSPSVVLIDSQSVKTTKVGGEARGFDGAKRLKGRKRHIVTDTQGFLLAVKVHAANEHDSKAGWDILRMIKHKYARIRKIYADGGYRGELEDKVSKELGMEMEITLRSDKATEFKPLPKRWVVERSFAWIGDFRRLAKDYERTVQSSETMIYLAFIALMIKLL